MKYNTIGGSTGVNEKKSTFTIYADMDLAQSKLTSNEAEITTLRNELENVQKALKQQTKRCRQLVSEYTKRLQQKEQQYQNEKSLRNDQLAKVLRALIIFEARLRQEQKYISNQLKEKDIIIKRQNEEIKRLLEENHCKNCSSSIQTDSSSEYVGSNFESLDSSSDIYATVSDDSSNKIFAKNTNKNSLTRRSKSKIVHRKSVGTYFEVLKMRNDEQTVTDLDEIPTKFDDKNFDPTNDTWYASGSDQEDEEQRDVYKNNPVLECMNQILLQNIADTNSPPKTPNPERKNAKKVQFSDNVASLTKENIEDVAYYETPVQKIPNFYETPQSIYSNDYEQILSKCNESFVEKKNHFYIDLEKPKKTPPALPPKPTNLILKYKKKEEIAESEPDYCSISELNLPPTKAFKKINVVAEINSPNSIEVLKKIESPPELVKKPIDKINVQVAKTIRSGDSPPKKPEPEIPKLPQVSEILIPEEPERINHDNYVKNNSQILKTKTRKSIVMGTSVSSLISGFNNQLISEIQKPPKSTFDLSQNFEEFNLDDCDIEEFEPKSSNVESVRAIELNPNSVELFQKQLEKKPEPTYEHFLECTGLSSKAIVTPSRLLSNHKGMLKPKDIKLRSRVKSQVLENVGGDGVKYWSEPYL